MSVHAEGARSSRRASKSLLDVAAEVLVADPAASLAEVAEAAGIGRTTLHKHYATRDDLMRAVAHRAVELWDAAIDAVTDGPDGPDGPDRPDDPDGGLHALVEAMIPIGPQLSFLWRNPIFDHDPEILEGWRVVEARGLAIVKRAQAHGVVSAAPDWWLLQTLYSLVYVAAESVGTGHLAARDAGALVLSTFLRGVGTPPSSPGEDRE